MQTTERLSLNKPQISDDIHESIQWISDNFQKVDDSFDESIADITAFLTEGNIYESGKKYWNNTPSINGYVGWINLREGVHAPTWGTQVNYNLGDIVSAGRNDGHYYQCIIAGTSGTSEPLFSPTSNSITFDLNEVQIWDDSFNYNVNDIVIATNGDSDFYYKCTQQGMSGTVEPLWTNASGSNISDGGTVWRSYKTVQWRESGVGCEFVTFGQNLGSTTKYAQNIGDGSESSFIVTHNLKTQDVVVMVRETGSPFAKEEVEVEVTDANNILVKFVNPPTENQYRVVVIG